tara:strand:- start:37 stop:195 length:159 start_codon:yes stop_codon:yes gene_type:complete
LHTVPSHFHFAPDTGIKWRGAVPLMGILAMTLPELIDLLPFGNFAEHFLLRS